VIIYSFNSILTFLLEGSFKRFRQFGIGGNGEEGYLKWEDDRKLILHRSGCEVLLFKV
jgi:hypothetical protein